ncbi:hypothetical protein SAMN05216249_10471 [Acetitomaculum ruminis DSM 5522]|uniref:Uncharacterized protein n=1 Tax=Acetitomaculum ruminis DSM 5522 TaxID=1120918 RepID=A0A1I0WHM7_9FIRM|nr:hypothetical protein [Acetitomaculum ruminis]SFA87897.1 hypothetical protein SAMN05216249_10471 [Acetitomaculum ruminis DSM 5522]
MRLDVVNDIIKGQLIFKNLTKKRFKNTEEARLNGAAWALKRIDEEGIENFREELVRRNACYIPLELNLKAVKEILEEFAAEVEQTTLDTYMIMAFCILIDGWGWDKEELTAFYGLFEGNTHRMAEGMVSWDELINKVKEERQIEMSINWGKRIDPTKDFKKADEDD